MMVIPIEEYVTVIFKSIENVNICVAIYTYNTMMNFAKIMEQSTILIGYLLWDMISIY